jgi:hypothetical protein
MVSVGLEDQATVEVGRVDQVTALEAHLCTITLALTHILILTHIMAGGHMYFFTQVQCGIPLVFSLQQSP